MKGPTGLLYGKSAPGGLVNMVSKKPTHETQVNFSQDVGSNNHARTVADVSGSLNADQSLRGRVVLAKEDYDSWRRYGDGTKPSIDRFVGGLFLDYDINDDVTVSVHYDQKIKEVLTLALMWLMAKLFVVTNIFGMLSGQLLITPFKTRALMSKHN